MRKIKAISYIVKERTPEIDPFICVNSLQCVDVKIEVSDDTVPEFNGTYSYRIFSGEDRDVGSMNPDELEKMIYRIVKRDFNDLIKEEKEGLIRRLLRKAGWIR